ARVADGAVRGLERDQVARRRVATAPQRVGVAARGHDTLHRPRGGLCVRRVALQLSEAAGGVLRVAREGERGLHGLRPALAGGRQRLEDGAGVVRVARAALRPEAEPTVPVLLALDPE